MPPKFQPKFPLNEPQLQAVEEILPALRPLQEVSHYIQGLLPFLQEKQNKPTIAFVDRMCKELDIPIKRTHMARLEYLLAALIQSKADPAKLIEHCMEVLGDKVDHLDEQFKSKFGDAAVQMEHLRATWQGEAEDSDQESSEEPDKSKAAPPCHKCGKIPPMAGAKFCFHCGIAAEKPRAPAGTIACTQCKKSMPDTQAFCQDCGRKNALAAIPERTTRSVLLQCQKCQAVLPKEQPFCSTCGKMNAKGPKATPKQPQFLYDEARETLVDKQNPRMKPGAAPRQWQPRPAIHQWVGPKEGPDKFTFKTLKKIQGHLYQAAHDQDPLVIPPLDEPIAWVECSAPQRALCEAEAQMQILYKVHEQGMSWGAAKRSMGYGDEVYSMAEKQQMANLAQAEAKIAKKMQKVNTKEEYPGKKRGDFKQWPKKSTEAKGDTATTSEESMKTFNKRIQQLEAALNKGGHVQTDKKQAKG